MDYNDFLKEKEKIEKLSIAEQKSFYEQLLKNKHDKTEVHVMASFCYGHLFQQEENFRKTIEIIEPTVVDYQSYSYTPKLLSCFNMDEAVVPESFKERAIGIGGDMAGAITDIREQIV